MCVAGAMAADHARAQGDVAMYGNLDIVLKKRSGEPVAVGRGYNNWLGWRGGERMAGGVKAFFVAEMRFDLDTGGQERARTLMQGETTVGLRSSALGSLRLGRALTPLWQDIWKFDPWINSGENASLSAYQSGSYTSDGVRDAAIGYADFSRFENAVFYISPVYAGWSAHVAADMERGPLDVRRPAGLSLNYAAGGVGGQVALERNANDDRIVFVAASWQTGKLKLMGSIAHIAPRPRQRARKEQVTMVAAVLRVGAHSLRTGYGRNVSLDHDKVSLGAIHHLSTRTGLYADLYHERAARDVTGAALGIMHAF